MKKLLLIGMMLLASGCNAGVDEGKSITQLQAEIAQKQAAVERAKVSGGYPVRTPSIVCINGVLYYVSRTYGGGEVYSAAFNPNTNWPYKCNVGSVGDSTE